MKMKPGQSRRGRAVLSPLIDTYRSYRRWQKDRGRNAKAKKHFRNMSAFYSAYIGRGDLCFDIGANMGNRTKVFLGLGASVVAVEPQEKCAEVLMERFGEHPNFVLVKKALDKSDGRKELLVSSAHTLSSLSTDWVRYVKEAEVFSGHDWDDKVEVETTTLDSLIALHGCPALCKIDVEGFEYNVLQGLSQPVKMISLEFTGGFVGPAVDSIRHLTILGDCMFNYSLGESMSLFSSDWIDSDEMIQILSQLGPKTSGDVYTRFRV